MKTIKTTPSNIEHYKKQWSNLKHVKTGRGFNGVLLIDGETVAAVLQCNLETGYIVALEVAPAYQRQGLASQLLKMAVDQFCCRKLTVRDTNAAAIALYAKTGYIPFDQQGIMLYMEKPEKEGGDMPSKSWAQHRLMEKAAHDKKFAKEKGIDQKVAKEFIEADKKEGLTTEEAFNKKNNKTLTGASSPKELLAWMNQNLTYHGANKKRLLLPKEIVEEKKGHCWEIANLAYGELTALGRKCSLLYMEDEGHKRTHTTLLYEESGKCFWFEWAWGANEGIHGPYKTMEEVTQLVIKKFKNQYQSVKVATLGHGRIKENMTEVEYIHMVDGWKNVLPKQPKPKYADWAKKD